MPIEPKKPIIEETKSTAEDKKDDLTAEQIEDRKYTRFPEDSLEEEYIWD